MPGHTLGKGCTNTYLSGNIRILFAIAITKVGIDIITSWNFFKGLENNSWVVICNHIGITILWFVDFKVTVIPSKLLSWFNWLKIVQKHALISAVRELKIWIVNMSPTVNNFYSHEQWEFKDHLNHNPRKVCILYLAMLMWRWFLVN